MSVWPGGAVRVTYGRFVSVRVAGLVISEPRIAFEVDRSADRTSDKARLALYNLAPGTQHSIYERSGPVTLSAGYEGAVGELFTGQVQEVEQERTISAGVTRITRIRCGDLNRAVRPVSGVAAVGGGD